MKHVRLFLPLAVLGAVLVTAASAAVASASAPSAPVRSKPAGYTVVTKSFPATAGVESGGQARCPKGTVPLGGGVFVNT